MTACTGVRNGNDFFGRKLSSKINDSPGFTLVASFFHESKKLRNPGFLSECVGLPILFGWRVFCIYMFVNYKVIIYESDLYMIVRTISLSQWA